MDGTEQIDIDDLEAGQVLGERYELREQIGEGGFALVWEAFDRNIERAVAIKFLIANLNQIDESRAEKVVARFEREAKLAARIEHPNVVHIYDYGVLTGKIANPFIVMERLRGHDLETQIFEMGALRAPRALPLFVKCLEGLGKAHRAGIVHKDLKPGNIFFASPGRREETFRLVDFGIAFVENAAAGRLTRTGEYLGTPHYMAPEYIDRQSVSPTVDVYQMGLILVEVLWGAPVVDESVPIRCLQRHLMGDLEVPRSLMESALGPVLAIALARDPERRFQNAIDFADALASIDPEKIPGVPRGNIPLTNPVLSAIEVKGALEETEIVQQHEAESVRDTYEDLTEEQRELAYADTAEQKRPGSPSTANRLEELERALGQETPHPADSHRIVWPADKGPQNERGPSTQERTRLWRPDEDTLDAPQDDHRLRTILAASLGALLLAGSALLVATYTSKNEAAIQITSPKSDENTEENPAPMAIENGQPEPGSPKASSDTAAPVDKAKSTPTEVERATDSNENDTQEHATDTRVSARQDRESKQSEDAPREKPSGDDTTDDSRKDVASKREKSESPARDKDSPSKEKESLQQEKETSDDSDEDESQEPGLEVELMPTEEPDGKESTVEVEVWPEVD